MAIDDFENKLGEGSEGSEEDLQQHQTKAVESEQLEGETQADAASQPEEAIASTEDDSTPENQTIRMPAPDAAPKSSEPPAFQTQKSPIPNIGAAPKSKGAALLTKLLASKNGRIGVGIAAAVLVLFTLFSTHIICFHNWQEPTCTSPSICKTCGRSKGDPLGHDWQEATCTEPKTCARCGKTDGKALGHDVKDWTVTKEATCTAEGEESGKCARCGETPKREVPMKEHSFGEWETVKAATCTEKGESHRVCSVCGFEETKELEKIEHNPGDWEVVQDVTVTKSGEIIDGRRARVCTVCGTELESEPYTISVSTSQKNALRTAASYLNYAPFSYKGLVRQLEFEGFSNEDASFAADHCGADWREQALRCAKSYLNYSPFSHSGLIEQLEFEGFSTDDSTYAADNCGADWNEQAAKCAKSYLDFMGFSRDGLIDQLMFEGFTYDQAVYGVEAVGL